MPAIHFEKFTQPQVLRAIRRNLLDQVFHRMATTIMMSTARATSSRADNFWKERFPAPGG